MYFVQRQSNLELFRIILMMGIIAHHFVVNSGLLDIMSPSLENTNDVFLWIWGMWGKIGINCFVLITGFFMCQSIFTWKKFLKLVCEIEFYKIIIYVIFLFSGKENISIERLFLILSPITTLYTALRLSSNPGSARGRRGEQHGGFGSRGSRRVPRHQRSEGVSGP